MKRLSCILLLLTTVLAMQAQMVDPVQFTSALKTADGSDEGQLVFTAQIEPGWHVYSTNLGQDGPIEASLHVQRMVGAELVGKLKPVGKEIKQFDEMFGMELRFFENTAQFVQKIRFTKPQYDISCYLEYGACNDQMCMPPTQVELVAKGEKKEMRSEDTTQDIGIANADEQVADSTSQSSLITSHSSSDGSDLWTPVITEMKALGGAASQIADRSLLYILLMGFIGGLLAVLMPCIWPIIPMTVSFFLKRAKTDKKKGIRDAITYGISIIVIYLALGLIVTSLFGSDTLNALSTNAFFNIFLFLLLVVFALSFFGWFEIKLPSRWADSVDTKATELGRKKNGRWSMVNGQLSIFLMAFTLVLVSFSCTAPIIGLLLVETTTSGNWVAPAVGMFGFALALALPFTLFALFPSWLKQAPKSGSWMTTIKVVLGFIELAFALKFFSVADLAYGWHLMDREVFLSLWIVIFALLGAYLCGWLRFQVDDTDDEQTAMMSGQPVRRRAKPVVCIVGGLISFAFAIYMVPGLWGAPCKAVSAFAPPMNTQDFNLNTRTVEARFTDYEQGMAAARQEGKPVLIDFTGFGCVNCRKMEAAVWTDPRVADKLKNRFVLISLYVDDKTSLPQPFEVTDQQGNKRTLTTVGAKWSYLQSHKFGANAQPYYVMLDNNGHPLAGNRAYDEDIDAYLKFLNGGLAAFGKVKK